MADSRTTFNMTTGLRGVYSINHFRSTHPVISTYQGSKNIGVNLFINLDFGGRLCFQPEIMYVKRDAYTLTQYNTYKIERWYDFDLLQIPVLAHYKLLEGKTEIYLSAGPHAHIPLKKFGYYKITSENGRILNEFQFDNGIDMRYIGLIAGLGGNYHLGKTTINAEIRYDHTFMAEEPDLFMLLFHSVQLMIGVGF